MSIFNSSHNYHSKDILFYSIFFEFQKSVSTILLIENFLYDHILISDNEIFFFFVVLNKIKFQAQLYAAPENQLINYPDGYTDS